MIINKNPYEDRLTTLQEITKKPTSFLETSEELCDQIKGELKEIYDFVKREETRKGKSNALSQLVVQNFDLEQIWQQIELQNDDVILDSLTWVSKLVVGKSGLFFQPQEDLEASDAEELEPGDAEKSENEENLPDIDVETDSENEEPEEKPAKEPKKTKSSVVDDDFFKLSEMENFLKTQEQENSPDSGNDSDSESEASVDLFEAESDQDEAKTAKYKDFFVSNFEERQNRIRKKIEEIEDDALEERTWQLRGEITAEKRPQNSLLEEVVEFDLSTRPAPVITEQTTFQLEDIIKQRIKDRAFDSVERKTRHVETPLEYKKKLVLDQEKSKESLAQIYEKEFLEQRAALDNPEKEEEEPELHKEIDSAMRSLFVQLDALSNFHFTPKPAIPELKIVSNLPAISMEEVAPVAVSDAALLAPEEVQRKGKGDEMGKGERTATDKKRERRKKKLKQKMHKKEKEKKEGGTEKGVKKVAGKERNKSLKSSTAFFTELEETVKSGIAKKRETTSKKTGPSAKKLKL